MRTYTQEEKQAVIDRVISGEPFAHILADTGIPKSRPFESYVLPHQIKNQTEKVWFFCLSMCCKKDASDIFAYEFEL